METLPDNIGNLEVALRYAALGYRCIPLYPRTKIAKVKWLAYQKECPSAGDYQAWFERTKNGIAIVTGDVVVVDCDSAEIVADVLRHCGDTPMRTATPTPGRQHLWYRARKGVVYGNSVGIKGKPIDLRALGAYAVVPPSTYEGVPYRWLGEVVPAAELPIIRVQWLREKRTKMKAIEPIDDSDLMVRRARAYLATIEGATSGNEGHKRTMRVAGKLIQQFRLSIAQALPLILEWNERCDPPWSEKELLHKLQDAYRLRFKSGMRGSQ